MAILTIISFVLIGGLLIFIHRGGHFVVRRAIYGAEQPVDPALSVDRRSVCARIAIVLAGPAANFLLAVLLFWGVLALVGRPGFLPTVGKPEPGSAAAISGLQAGDRIVTVVGRPVRTWGDVDAAIQATKGKPVSFKIERDEGRWEVTITPRLKIFTDGFGVKQYVWTIGVGPFVSTTVGNVLEGFPAGDAGIRVGDRIVAVNGAPIETWEELTERIHPRAGQRVRLRVERDGKRFDVTLEPKASARQEIRGRTVTRGVIGATPKQGVAYRRLAPVTALVEAARRTSAQITLIFQSVWHTVAAVVSGQSKDDPILLAQLADEQHRRGFVDQIIFTAILSINLGVLNLLPLPFLDGERLCFLLVELVQRRPVSLGLRRFVQWAVVLLLVVLLVQSFAHNILQIFKKL